MVQRNYLSGIYKTIKGGRHTSAILKIPKNITTKQRNMNIKNSLIASALMAIACISCKNDKTENWMDHSVDVASARNSREDGRHWRASTLYLDSLSARLC